VFVVTVQTLSVQACVSDEPLSIAIFFMRGVILWVAASEIQVGFLSNRFRFAGASRTTPSAIS
jgi:hypothetical protein